MSAEQDSWDDSIPQDEPATAVGDADGGAEEGGAAAAPQEAAAAQPPKLNPSAASFSFNPSASTFSPGGAAGASAAPPAAAPPRTAPTAAGEADRRAGEPCAAGSHTRDCHCSPAAVAALAWRCVAAGRAHRVNFPCRLTPPRLSGQTPVSTRSPPACGTCPQTRRRRTSRRRTTLRTTGECLQ